MVQQMKASAAELGDLSQTQPHVTEGEKSTLSSCPLPPHRLWLLPTYMKINSFFKIQLLKCIFGEFCLQWFYRLQRLSRLAKVWSSQVFPGLRKTKKGLALTENLLEGLDREESEAEYIGESHNWERIQGIYASGGSKSN